MTLMLATSLTLLGIVTLFVGLVAVQWRVMSFLREHVWAPSDGQVAHAKHFNVVRRYRESLTAWEARTVAAVNTLDAAIEAFRVEAERLGRLERVPETQAGVVWTLPLSHPLSVALTCARWPDGPPLDEATQLFQSGTCVVGGVDLLRVPR